MARGKVYVLVNSSIPGLVKVGRTSSSTKERSAKLSSATGVPTPFVVAFEQEFADCIAAEQSIHAELERRGTRVTASREFFRIDAAEVVRFMLELAGSQPPAGPDSAERLLDEGDAYLVGEGERLQDLAEAYRCYKLAAGRGSLVALERLGAIHARLKHRGRVDQRKALRYLKDGAKRGNYYCYCEIAILMSASEHFENASKAWHLFFARRADSWMPEVEKGEGRFASAACRYILACLDRTEEPEHLMQLGQEVASVVDGFLHYIGKLHRDAEGRARMVEGLKWVYTSLLPAPVTKVVAFQGHFAVRRFRSYDVTALAAA